MCGCGRGRYVTLKDTVNADNTVVTGGYLTKAGLLRFSGPWEAARLRHVSMSYRGRSPAPSLPPCLGAFTPAAELESVVGTASCNSHAECALLVLSLACCMGFSLSHNSVPADPSPATLEEAGPIFSLERINRPIPKSVTSRWGDSLDCNALGNSA